MKRLPTVGKVGYRFLRLGSARSLLCARVTVSLSGAVVKPAQNPITATMSSGYHFEAVFGPL